MAVLQNLSDWKVCQLLQRGLDGNDQAVDILRLWATFSNYREPSHDDRVDGGEVK